MFNSINGLSFKDFQTIGFSQEMPIESSSTDSTQKSTPILEIPELSVEFQQKDKDLVQSLRKELIEHEFRGLPYGLLRKLNEIQSDKLHDDFVLDISKKIYSEYLDDNFLGPSRYEYAEVINQIRNPETRMNTFTEAAKDHLLKERYFEMRGFLRDIEPGKTRDGLVSELTTQLYRMKNYKEIPSTLAFIRDGKQKDELIVTFTEKLLETKEYGFAANTLAIMDSVKVKDDYSIKFFNKLCEQKLYAGAFCFSLLLSEEKQSNAVIKLSDKLFEEGLYVDAWRILREIPPSEVRDEAVLNLSNKLFSVKKYSEARKSLQLFDEKLQAHDPGGYKYYSFRVFGNKLAPTLIELANKLFDIQEYADAARAICSITKSIPAEAWHGVDRENAALCDHKLKEFAQKFLDQKLYEYAYVVLQQLSFYDTDKPILICKMAEDFFNLAEYDYAIKTLSHSGISKRDEHLALFAQKLFAIKEYSRAIEAGFSCSLPLEGYAILLDLSNKLLEVGEYSYSIDALKHIRQGKKQEDLAALSRKLFDLKEYNYAVEAIRAISFYNPYFPSESNKYRQQAATELANKLDAVVEKSFLTDWLAKVCRELASI